MVHFGITYCLKYFRLVGVHDFPDFIMRELCSTLCSRFLHKMLSVHHASILWKSIALLATIMWDAGDLTVRSNWGLTSLSAQLPVHTPRHHPHRPHSLLPLCPDFPSQLPPHLMSPSPPPLPVLNSVLKYSTNDTRVGRLAKFL